MTTRRVVVATIAVLIAAAIAAGVWFGFLRSVESEAHEGDSSASSPSPDPDDAGPAEEPLGTPPTTGAPAPGSGDSDIPGASRPATTSGAVPSTTDAPTPGASGVGDPLYPALGNGGYDVSHYSLELTYDPPTRFLQGLATLDITAVEALESFSLDFKSLEVRSVEVGGDPAVFSHDGSELVVTPSRPLVVGDETAVHVAYAGIAGEVATAALGAQIGWFDEDDGAYVMSEPDAASSIFPANDHPRDKATFEITLVLPRGFEGAANGLQVGEIERFPDGGSRTTFRHDFPMAPYLVAIGVGDFDVEEEVSEGGVPIRNYFEETVSDGVRGAFARQGEMIDFFAAIFGPYPFETYGALVVESAAGSFAALETQTLSTFPVGPEAQTYDEAIVAHEVVHQWLGNSVSLTDWDDIWLNEGFATYGEWLWTAERFAGGDVTGRVLNEYDLVSGQQFLDSGAEPANVDAILAENFPPPGAPPADNLFNGAVYLRGGLLLHALRLEIGDQPFFESLRTFADTFRFGNARTEDFIAIAEAAAERELDAFFDGWLFDEDPPPIPELGLEAPPDS